MTARKSALIPIGMARIGNTGRKKELRRKREKRNH